MTTNDLIEELQAIGSDLSDLDPEVHNLACERLRRLVEHVEGLYGEAREYRPVPGERWRTGTHVGRTIYRHVPAGAERGKFIGAMDTPQMARLVADLVNAHFDKQQTTEGEL